MQTTVATVRGFGKNAMVGVWLRKGASRGLRPAGARKGAVRVAEFTEFNKMHDRKGAALSRLSYARGERLFHILVR